MNGQASEKSPNIEADVERRNVLVEAGDVTLQGELARPKGATGLVLFAHGSGSSRHSPRNKYVASIIQRSGVATLLFDLLTSEEEAVDIRTRHLRFDIGMLAGRLVGAAEWVWTQTDFTAVRVGYFGSSTGAGAALMAAASLGERIGAVVSRGGRPDLAGAALPRVVSPTLLIVGARDYGVIELNQEAFSKLRCEKDLQLVPDATHLFEESGTLDEVARLASDWFARHLAAPGRSDASPASK